MFTEYIFSFFFLHLQDPEYNSRTMSIMRVTMKTTDAHTVMIMGTSGTD